jgi:hypothetical protein
MRCIETCARGANSEIARATQHAMAIKLAIENI